MTNPLTLLTDLYQLTMAEGYWKLGKHEQQTVFDLFFREHPFNGGYAIVCGLESIIKTIQQFVFTKTDVAYLATLKSSSGEPLFLKNFLELLQDLQLTIDVDAIPEGTVVFSKEPLLRIMGPLWQCQLLETVLLNLMNFPTLIATKASRICFAAQNDPIVEFGLRRAQGPNGGLTASRAAFVGGVESTSNVLAGQQFGIPVAGTHAHSWVMAFDSEQESFDAYATVMPHNCILLVDTYNTLEGVKKAIQVGLKLKRANKGHTLLGIRLDSGDLAELSIAARALLDDAGLQETKIVGSSDLDEYAIERLKKAGARISLWGVGTRLVTAYDQPALGSVYKLVAIKNKKGEWQYKAKTTDDMKKRSIGGIHNVHRFSKKGVFVRDVIYDIYKKKPSPVQDEIGEDLLVPIFRQGKLVYDAPSLTEIQKHSKSQLQQLPVALRSLKPTLEYPVLLSQD